MKNTELKEWYDGRIATEVQDSGETITVKRQVEFDKIDKTKIPVNLSASMVSVDFAEELLNSLRELSRASTNLLKTINTGGSDIYYSPREEESKEVMENRLSNNAMYYQNCLRRIKNIKKSIDKTMELFVFEEKSKEE